MAVSIKLGSFLVGILTMKSYYLGSTLGALIFGNFHMSHQSDLVRLPMSSWRHEMSEGMVVAIGGLPQIEGPILGVLITRTIVHCGLFWGRPMFGNSH